jgi:hypothetical protein
MSLHTDYSGPYAQAHSGPQVVPPSPRGSRNDSPGAVRRLLSWLDLKASPYLLVSPYFLLFAVFGLFPLAFTLYYSLFDYELTGEQEWVGLGNYTELLADDQFWKVVVNTLAMFVIATVPQLLLALMLAEQAVPGPAVRAHGRAAAARHLGGRGLRRLHPALRPRLGHGQLDSELVRHRPHRLEGRAHPLVAGDLDDGRLAVDRLQRDHLPRRHADHPA